MKKVPLTCEQVTANLKALKKKHGPALKCFEQWNGLYRIRGLKWEVIVGAKQVYVRYALSEAFPEGEPWTKVVKLSDEKGKYTGDPEEIALAKEILHIP